MFLKSDSVLVLNKKEIEDELSSYFLGNSVPYIKNIELLKITSSEIEIKLHTKAWFSPILIFEIPIIIKKDFILKLKLKKGGRHLVKILKLFSFLSSKISTDNEIINVNLLALNIIPNTIQYFIEKKLKSFTINISSNRDELKAEVFFLTKNTSIQEITLLKEQSIVVNEIAKAIKNNS